MARVSRTVHFSNTRIDDAVFPSAPQTAAVLVPIDGAPVWRPVQGTTLERVLNTRALVLLDGPSDRFYIHLFDGFLGGRFGGFRR